MRASAQIYEQLHVCLSRVICRARPLLRWKASPPTLRCDVSVSGGHQPHPIMHYAVRGLPALRSRLIHTAWRLWTDIQWMCSPSARRPKTQTRRNAKETRVQAPYITPGLVFYTSTLLEYDQSHSDTFICNILYNLYKWYIIIYYINLYNNNYNNIIIIIATTNFTINKSKSINQINPK